MLWYPHYTSDRPRAIATSLGRYLPWMSSNGRRRTHPESHLIERDLAPSPARAWDGHVCISGEHGTVSIRGTWHLEMPQEPRTMLTARRSRSLPLPARDDMNAWHAHLLRLVTLQIPGMQLRVQGADAASWTALEFAAPTRPASVVQLDRQGLVALLGEGASVSLTIDAHTGR
jgi:hypothetical protein